MANIKLKCRHSIFDDISNSCQIKLPGANEFSRLDMPYRYFDNSFRIAQSTIELYTVRVLLYMYTHYSAPIAWRGKKVSSHLPCLLSRLTPISHTKPFINFLLSPTLSLSLPRLLFMALAINHPFTVIKLVSFHVVKYNLRKRPSYH